MYPALAQHCADPFTPEWRQFIHNWPYTVPHDLIEFCKEHKFSYSINDSVADFYLISIGFFDFDVDYFGLINPKIKQRLKEHSLRVLFYYDEGDNPYKIKKRLDQLCDANGLDVDCYCFLSANTAANLIPGFNYFPSDELLYWTRNQQIPASKVHSLPRTKDFTALSRVHKLWRATAMADLHRQNLLDNSYWSYRTDVTVTNRPDENPLHIVTDIINSDLTKFLSGCPYSCDNLTSDQHNDHTMVELEHFNNSYCSIILETHFDTDGSNGTFLTEKTFKAIKHGHPFIIVGTPGSLHQLKLMGYRTFDHAIDNSYDTETDNVQRWVKIVRAITKLKQQNMHEWFLSCQDDILHNQRLFLSSKRWRLNNIYDFITH